MHNSEQVREFFRKMADGLILNSNSTPLLNSSNSISADRVNQEIRVTERVRRINDFGVGLPPLAQI
jgi:hypothetical protein